MLARICTKYGMLKGIVSVEYHLDGELEACMLSEKNEIEILDMNLVPLYNFQSSRRKEVPSITFYEGEDIKSLSLQEGTDISTKIGVFNVEKVTFYKGDKIKRLFLLDGRLTAYWAEEDEYKLAKNYCFSFEFTNFIAKIISLQFYESGNLKSLTLWPKEKVVVNTEDGMIAVRIGISLYEDGKLKSCEPSKGVNIKTPIGVLEAYDINAIGIHGESNSLEYYENGKIKSLITSSNSIDVYDKNNNLIKKFMPEVVHNNLIDGVDKIKTVKVTFNEDHSEITIDDKKKYKLNESIFIISKVKKNTLTLGNSCSNCHL